jgi:hypothetical protein
VKSNFSLKPAVPRKSLLLIAGIVWASAGIILLYKSILFFPKDHIHLAWSALSFAVVFIFFFWMLFLRVSRKHSERIKNLSSPHPCLFAFFSYRSYLLMFFMIGLGILMRRLGWIPAYILSPLYAGIGLPLLLSATRFWWLFFFEKSFPKEVSKNK